LGNIASVLAQGFLGGRASTMERMFKDYEQRKKEAAEKNKSALTTHQAQLEDARTAASRAGADLTRWRQQSAILTPELAPHAPGFTPGARVPLSVYENAVKAKAEKNKPKKDKPKNDPGSKSDNIIVSDAARKIALDIKEGRKRPDVLSRLNPRGDFRNQVEIALSDLGVDTNTMQMDLDAEKRFWSTQNSPKFQSIRNNARTLIHSLELIRDYNKQLRRLVPATTVPEINRVQLGLLMRRPGPEGQIARKLDRQVTDVAAELGSMYMGGNSNTDHSLQLAAKNMQSDWSEAQLNDAVDQGLTNLHIRLSAMNDAAPAMPSTAGIDDIFTRLSGQGMVTQSDFDAALDRKRADGRTLRRDLQDRGMEAAQIERLRSRFSSGRSTR